MITIQGSIEKNFEQIWWQSKVPVVFRMGVGHRLKVRLPYAETNKQWLMSFCRSKPKWDRDGRFWSLPSTKLNDFVNRTLDKYGQVYLIQPYREKEICASACWNARGYECNCSCMGARHGAGGDGRNWHEVSETCAILWEKLKYACRLLKK